MRARSQKHAEYEIVEYILQEMPFVGIFQRLGPKEDQVAYNRVTKACKKLRKELERKQEKLRKYLPEDHVDYEEKVEEI